jgi:hypothetical protein
MARSGLDRAEPKEKNFHYANAFQTTSERSWAAGRAGFMDPYRFEVRAWTDQFDKWPRIRSELAVAFYDAVHEQGMSFPFPQREVRLLNDYVGVSSVAVKPGGPQVPLQESRESGEGEPISNAKGPISNKAEEQG